MPALYWIPRPGDPTPRVNAFDVDGRKTLIPPQKIEGHPGVLRFNIPEHVKNKARLENVKAPWRLELPSDDSQPRTSQKTILKPDSPDKGESSRTPITRAELLLVLENNGIAFKKNSRTDTLWEKLPDDIARNFKLVESGATVQTE